MRISQEVSFSRGYRQVALCLSVLMEECSQTNESAMLRSEDLKRRREEQCYHQRKGRGQENYWAEEARPKQWEAQVSKNLNVNYDVVLTPITD